MDKVTLWESLCKPCSVTLEKLADSVINKSRRRTTPRQHPYPSRKRSSDNEIYNCRLLRPKRKLQFSSDGITSLAYMLNDLADDDTDERLFDRKSLHSDSNDEQSGQSADVPQMSLNFDDEDAITPAWKYKRKVRKLSDSSDNSEMSSNQQSIEQAVSNLMAREEEQRIGEEAGAENIDRNEKQNVTEQSVIVQSITEQSVTEQNVTEQNVTEQNVTEQNVTEQSVTERSVTEEHVAEQSDESDNQPNVKLDKEIKIPLERVEEVESGDPLVLTWKLRNGFITHDELEKHLEVFLNEKRNESLNNSNIEYSLDNGFTCVLHAVNEAEEPQEINSTAVESSVDTSVNETIGKECPKSPVKIVESQELPNANSQSVVLSSTKSPKSRKLNRRNYKWAGTKKSRARAKASKLTPKVTILQCRMCMMNCTSKEELAMHLYTHSSSDLQETFARAKQQADAENGAKSSAEGVSNDLEVLCVPKNNVGVSTNITANSADSGSEKLSGGMEISRRVSEESGDTMSVCSCHNKGNLQSEFSVQIEMVLFCETCKILFRRNECFETHYRVSRKCNEKRSVGRIPKLFCSTCRVMLNDLSNMRRHLEDHAKINFHGTVTFVCNICRVVFFGVGTVFCTHWFAHEKDPTFVASKHGFPKLCISENGVKPAGAGPHEQYLFVAEYVCRTCKQQFSSESELIKHTGDDCKRYLTSKEDDPLLAKSSPQQTVNVAPGNVRIRNVGSRHVGKSRNIIPRAVVKPTNIANKILAQPKNVVAKVVVQPRAIAPKPSATTPLSPPTLQPAPPPVPPPAPAPAPAPPPATRPPKNQIPFPWIASQKSTYFLKLVSKWDCSFCQQKNDTWENFEQHCQAHLQDSEYPGFYCSPQNARPAFICKVCRKLYNTLPDLMKHWATHNIIKFTCSNCIVPYPTLIEFLHHMKRGCWRVGPECRIQYLHQKYYCKVCKIGFQGLSELTQHDESIHKVKQKIAIPKAPKVANTTNEIAIVNVTTDPTAFDTPNDSLLYTLLSTDNVEIVTDGDSLQLQATVSDGNSAAVSSNVDDVNQQALLMSLVYDNDGNYQLVPSNTQYNITKCDTTFQGSKVVTSTIPIINNNNEIIDVSAPQLIVQAANVEVTSTDTPTIEVLDQFEVVNYEEQVTEVDEPEVIDVSKDNEKLISSERNSVISVNIDQPKNKEKVVDKFSNADSITIHSSSSDRDSEILLDKVCTKAGKRLDDKADTAVASDESTKDKGSDKIQCVSSSPSKTASAPRLRVKNFSELLAVKNYICQRCNAAFDNETSLTEHLTAHLNSMIGIGAAPTMRAALMLPSTAVDTNTTASQSLQQSTSSMSSQIAGKRILPTIPTRNQGPNSRKATALNRTQVDDGFVGQNQVSPSLPYSYPVYTNPYPKQNEIQQPVIVNAPNDVNNITQLQMAQLIPITQMNSQQLPQNTLTETEPTDAGGSTKERQRTYNCRVCRFVTTDRQYIVRHVKHHLSTNNEDQLRININQVNTNPPPLTAVPAPMMHQYNQSLNTANTSTQLQQIYNCNNYQNMNSNDRNELNNRFAAQRLTGSFCMQCRMYFPSEEYLKSHMSQYHQTYCKNCRQRFKSYRDLSDHICCPPNPWT